jgi:ADP-ribose pyrophosphatase
MSQSTKSGDSMSQNLEPVTVIAEGRFIRLVKRGRWEFVERNKVSGIVGLVAITPDQKILLVEHFNPPFGKQSIELPAGLAGDVAGKEGEALDAAAFRELLEETGYAAEKLVYLATGTSSSGLCTEQISLFRAAGMKQVGPGGGVDDENITVHQIPLAEAREWLASRRDGGCIIDMKIYAALYFANAERSDCQGR